MIEALTLRLSRRPARFPMTVAMVILLPMLALALLSLWFVEAEKIARAQDRHQSEQAVAEMLAQSIQRRLDARMATLSAAVLAQYDAGGAQAVRNHYLSQPDLAMAALFDTAGGQIFPEPQELPIFAENHFLQQAQVRLSEARMAAARDGHAWSGSLFEPASPVIGCHAAGALTVCLLLPPSVLREIAQPALLVDLAAPSRVASGLVRVLAPLPPPFTGLAVAVDYRPEAGQSWLTVALLIAPTLVGTGIAAVFLVLGQRAQIRAAQHRVDTLAEISHELRTPLANLRLYSNMLRTPGREPGQIARFAQIVEDETARLSGIVENALAVTVGGRIPAPELEEASPDDLVLALLDRFDPGLAPMPRPDLDLRAGAAVRFDVSSFEQVLINLLDNARKYASGARVCVTTRIAEGRLTLEVSDDGARGVAPQDGLRGFGLGLNACRSMAARAGGRFDHQITVTGARFALVLPVQDPSKQAGQGATCAC